MKAHEWCVAAVLTAVALPTQATPCTLVFGQGRNTGEAAEIAAWDELNQRLHARVLVQLEDKGRRVLGWVASTTAIEPASHVEQLLRVAREQSCFTVLETTVFADADGDLLIARLRAYPVLPAVGGQEGHFGLRIGAPFFSSQRDSAGVNRAVARFKAELVADLLVSDYLRRP